MFGRSGGLKTCDDCGREYPGPAYYTFTADNCVTVEKSGDTSPHLDCTENLCPDCSGPDLEPDRRDDERRPARVNGGLGSFLFGREQREN